jgi:hypothetical protein
MPLLLMHLINLAMKTIKANRITLAAIASFSIAPNPSTGKIMITADQPLATSEFIIAEVYNVLGEKVMDKQGSPDGLQIQVEMTGAPDGIYYVKLKSNTGKLLGAKAFVTARN